jgi:hypothetical protein
MHWSQLKGNSLVFYIVAARLGSRPQYCPPFVMHARRWVPSPLEGEGQDEGETVRSSLAPQDTFTLALSHQGRGENKRRRAAEVVAGG